MPVSISQALQNLSILSFFIFFLDFHHSQYFFLTLALVYFNIVLQDLHDYPTNFKDMFLQGKILLTSSTFPSPSHFSLMFSQLAATLTLDLIAIFCAILCLPDC